MNTVTLKKASERGGPVVLAAGATTLLVVLLGALHDQPGVSAQPAPTVTTTVTAAPVPVTKSVSPTPSTSGNSPPGASGVEPASRTQRHVSAPGKSPRTGGRTPPPSTAPRPSPTINPPAADSCSGQLLAVRLLGAACVSLGGSR